MFEKGHKIGIVHKGRKLSKEWKEKISLSRKGKYIDEKHGRWRGDNVGYMALHIWIAKKLGKPAKCEHCSTTKAKKYNWANKSREYKRDLEDWIRLCTKCHVQYDKPWLKRHKKLSI